LAKTKSQRKQNKDPIKVMSEKFVIEAQVREGRGKNDSRRIRAAGKVPVTIYGGDGGSVSAVAELADLARVIRSKTGVASIFNVAIDGQETEVMFQDRQIDPIKGRLLHADLLRIVKGSKLDVNIPVNLEGEPFGVKSEGGILEQVLYELHLRCDSDHIPEGIIADVSEMKVGDVLHVSDLKLAEGVEVVNAPETVVATIKVISEEEFAEALTSQVEEAEPEVESSKESEEE
jgi:large subunit ribosomal protein L25